MKIVACGCSYTAGDKRHPGTNYTDVLAKELGCELINLAKGGSSNFTIRLQAEYALQHHPDALLLVVPTSPNRIEMEIHGCDYHIQDGIRNVNYRGYNGSWNAHNIQHIDPRIHSDTILNIIKGHNDTLSRDVSADRRETVKQWFTDVFSHNLKLHQDLMILEGLALKMMLKDARFIMAIRGDWLPYFSDIAPKHLFPKSPLELPRDNIRNDHLTSDQHRAFALELVNHLKTNDI